MTAGPGGAAPQPPAPGPDGRMTDIEALMWRLGAHDPRLRPTMTLLVGFDRAVDRTHLAERIGRLTRRVPLLRRRVDSGFGPVPPRWEPTPDFSVDHHLRVAHGAGPLDAEGVARDLLGRPFPPGRPPWLVVLVPGPPDHLVLHLHHSYTDGMGGVRLLGELFDLEPSMAAAVDEPPGAGGPEPASGDPTGAEDLLAEMTRAVRLAGRALPWAARTVREASQHPESVLGAATDLLGRLRPLLVAATGPASPALRPRSDGVVLASLELPLGALRRTGRRLGTTINDVFLGGLLEGLARYHEKCALLPPSLRLGVPISARGADGDMGMHNQLYGTLLRGPLGPLDFEERTRLVHEMVGAARAQPWASWLDDAAGVACRVPGAVGLVAAALGSLDVLASNVTGPPFPLWLGRALVERMVPIGPRSGSAVNVTLLSYRERAAIGFNLDPAAVADPAVLVDCVRGAFDDHLEGPDGPETR